MMPNAISIRCEESATTLLTAMIITFRSPLNPYPTDAKVSDPLKLTSMVSSPLQMHLIENSADTQFSRCNLHFNLRVFATLWPSNFYLNTWMSCKEAL